MQTENRLADKVGKGEGGQTESSIETCILPYVKYMATGSCYTGSQLVLCENLEGWDGRRGGKEVQKGEDICILMAYSCMYNE